MHKDQAVWIVIPTTLTFLMEDVAHFGIFLLYYFAIDV